jgi:hypothetical protein
VLSACAAVVTTRRVKMAIRFIVRGDLGLGVVVTDNSKGVRLEADVLAHDGWSAGITLGLATSTWRFGDQISGARLVFDDVRAALTLAKTFVRGAWRLRVQTGVGLFESDYAGTMEMTFVPPMDVEGSTEIGRMFEATATVAYEVDRGLSIAVGPLLSYYDQQFTLALGHLQEPVTREYEVGGWLSIRKHL